MPTDAHLLSPTRPSRGNSKEMLFLFFLPAQGDQYVVQKAAPSSKAPLDTYFHLDQPAQHSINLPIISPSTVDIYFTELDCCPAASALARRSSTVMLSSQG